MEDPRQEFQAGKDRQVLVAFEWEGHAGHHRCEGTWKDPEGRAVFTSQAEVDARGPRFGVYWGLSLPDTVATGTWIVEAKIDGEAAGVHAFQIRADPVTLEQQGQRVLSLAELYRTGSSVTQSLEVFDVKGKLLRATSGFYLEPDLILTSFSGINAAHMVRMTGPADSHVETGEIASWNRRNDWAMLRFPGANGRPPTRAAKGLQVGDRCFFLDSQGDAGRVIVDTSVVGQTPNGDLSLGTPASEGSLGGPVLNEYGEVAAFLAGNGLFGGTALDAISSAGLRAVVPRATRALAVPAAPTAPGGATLGELTARGVFVRPLVHTPHFVSGVMGTGIQYQGKVPMASDQRFRFSRRDGQCLVFMTWTPAEKEDAVLVFELYDEDNRRVAASEERKVKMRSGETFVQWWTTALTSLRPGTYRVDAIKASEPVWRTFFRLTD